MLSLSKHDFSHGVWREAMLSLSKHDFCYAASRGLAREEEEFDRQTKN
jgi:hypothetical protein